jgi:hypothetical protein
LADYALPRPAILELKREKPRPVPIEVPIRS